jgi:hypothetical protein
MNDVVQYKPPLNAGGRPQAIVPQNLEEAYRLATAVCKAKMAPKGLDTPESALIAILHGLEIGLPPMTALQRIAVVNGRPTLWGDVAIALVRRSGLCENIKETTEGTGDNRAAVCEAKRRGEPGIVKRRFSVADARIAGLWNKEGPWRQYPDRMLQMRARAFCLRDLFADVLGGLYLREELDDGNSQRDPIGLPPPPANGPSAPEPPPPEPLARQELRKALQASVELADEQRADNQKPPALDLNTAEGRLTLFENMASKATTVDMLETAYDQTIKEIESSMFPPDLDEALRIFRWRKAELEG